MESIILNLLNLTGEERAALEACRTPYAVTDMSKY